MMRSFGIIIAFFFLTTMSLGSFSACQSEDTASQKLTAIDSSGQQISASALSNDCLKIIINPSLNTPTDSLLEKQLSSFARSVYDTLIRLSDKLELMNVQFHFMDSTVNNNQPHISNEPPSKNLHQKSAVSFLIWWKIVNDPIKINTVLTISDSVSNGLSQQNVLLTAMGFPNNFTLPFYTADSLHTLADFIIGLLLQRYGRYPEAIHYFRTVEKTLMVHPMHQFSIHFNLGDSYLKQGRLMTHAIALSKAQFDTAIYYYEKCLGDSDHVDDKNDLIWVYNNMAIAHQLSGNTDQALMYFNLALTKKINTCTDASVIRIFNNIGNLYLLKGEWSRALEIYQQSISSMEALGDKKELALTYDNMGHIYQLLLQRLNAIQYYEKSLSLREELSDQSGIAISYGNLGDVYFDKKDFTNALEHYARELTLNKQLHNEPRIARSYDNLGLTFQKKGELDSAIYYFQKSIELMEMIGSKSNIITSTNHLAAAYVKAGNLEKSLEIYRNNKILAEQTGDEIALSNIFDQMAKIYNTRQELDKALEYYEYCADLQEKLNLHESRSFVMFNMGLINLKLHNYAAGYMLLKEAIEIDEKYGFGNLSAEKDFVDDIRQLMNRTSN